MPLVTRERICKSHKEGGFGIPQLDVVQKACLIKHLVKCFDGAISLRTRMIKFKFKTSNVFGI